MTERPQEIILRPLGPQGPLVGIEINNVGDYIALDLAMGQLTAAERKTIKGIFKAVSWAGLNIIDSSTLADEKDIISPYGNI